MSREKLGSEKLYNPFPQQRPKRLTTTEHGPHLTNRDRMSWLSASWPVVAVRPMYAFLFHPAGRFRSTSRMHDVYSPEFFESSAMLTLPCC